jgi:hypothetical protein
VRTPSSSLRFDEQAQRAWEDMLLQAHQQPSLADSMSVSTSQRPPPTPATGRLLGLDDSAYVRHTNGGRASASGSPPVEETQQQLPQGKGNGEVQSGGGDKRSVLGH